MAKYAILALLVVAAACYSSHSIPAMWLNNWDDMIVMWHGNRRILTEKPSVPIGVYDVRTSGNWDVNSVSADAFVLRVGGKLFGKPELFDGDSFLAQNNTMVTNYHTYDGQKLDFTLVGHVTAVTNQPFYIRRYFVSDPSRRPISLMSFLNTDTPANSGHVWGWYDAKTSLWAVDVKPTGQYIATYPATTPTSWTIGEPGGATDPIAQFTKGALAKQDVCDASEASIAFQHDGTGTLEVSLVRVVGKNYNDAVKKAQAAHKNTPAAWLKQSAAAVEKWLGQGTMPSGTKDEVQYFRTSLLLLKNAQNPKVGTISASFHPVYAYKTWSRDGAFAAIILDSAGYHKEAAAYIEWMSTAELTDGHYHTTYSTFTGRPVSFVEPQLDPMGTWLLAVGYHIKLTNDISFARRMSNRMGEVQAYFVHNVGPGGLTAPDYSIWEESSDPITGDGLPTGYFTFSQSMAAGGLVAASRVWRMLGQSGPASEALARSMEIRRGVLTKLWLENDQHFARQLWGNTQQADKRLDGSTAAPLWLGLLDVTDAKYNQHLNAIRSKLTRDNHGIARYEGDVFFHRGKWNPAGPFVPEVSSDMPAWGVVTMFTAWAELAAGIDIKPRLEWMRERSAFGGVPVGEAVDGETAHRDVFVFSSAPDVYEHAGVYVMGTLLSQNKCVPVDPHKW